MSHFIWESISHIRTAWLFCCCWNILLQKTDLGINSQYDCSVVFLNVLLSQQARKLQATLVSGSRNYDPLTYSLTGMRCRATSVAKNIYHLLKVAVNIVPRIVWIPALSVLLYTRPAHNCNWCQSDLVGFYLNIDRSSVIIRFLVFSPGTFNQQHQYSDSFVAPCFWWCWWWSSLFCWS